MSPTSGIYDHLTINANQQSKQTRIGHSNKSYLSSSKSNSENLHMLTKRKSFPYDEHEQSKRRYTITNTSMPETIIRCSVSNQAYEKPMIERPVSNQILSQCQQTNTKSYRIATSLSSTEIRSMDFRPLIISGRRKLGGISTSSSMIIIKKKSPSPMNNISYNQVSIHIHINDIIGIYIAI